MSGRQRGLAIMSGLLAGALAYWFQPYGETAVFGMSIYHIAGMGSFLASLVCVLFFENRPSKSALLVSLGVILAVISRIIYDTLFWDSTSHNLAPFEIIFIGIVALPCAFAGAYLIRLFRAPA